MVAKVGSVVHLLAASSMVTPPDTKFSKLLSICLMARRVYYRCTWNINLLRIAENNDAAIPSATIFLAASMALVSLWKNNSLYVGLSGFLSYD